MTTLAHQLLSRKTSTPEVWQCECEHSTHSAVSVTALRMGYAEVVFIQPDGKLDTTRRGAWQRLATWHQGDVAVTNGHCSRTVLPLTPSETRKLAAWELRTFSSLSQTFCPPISQDLNTVNLPSGLWSALQQTVYHHQSFSSVDKMKRAIAKSMAKTTARRSHCQFITFIKSLAGGRCGWFLGVGISHETRSRDRRSGSGSRILPAV